MNEVRTTAALEHPNIVTAFEAGEDRDDRQADWPALITDIDRVLNGKLPAGADAPAIRNVTRKPSVVAAAKMKAPQKLRRAVRKEPDVAPQSTAIGGGWSSRLQRAHEFRAATVRRELTRYLFVARLFFASAFFASARFARAFTRAFRRAFSLMISRYFSRYRLLSASRCSGCFLR